MAPRRAGLMGARDVPGLSSHKSDHAAVSGARRRARASRLPGDAPGAHGARLRRLRQRRRRSPPQCRRSAAAAHRRLPSSTIRSPVT
eukprot:7081171-Prymnesium_polylepis.1